MAQWIIYGSNGVAKAAVKELELHDEWMAECFVTISVTSAEPIAFAVGDYIDYRGERYTIQYDPNVLKKAESGSYGEGFTYDNIKFVGLQDEVVRCDFNDIVLNDNNVHYTALPTFPFYCETVDDLLDRIQANLEELYPGQWIVIGLNTVRNSQRGTAVGRAQAFINAYKQYIDPTGAANTEPYGKQGVAETVDNITCWDAMKKVHDDFELNFIVRGRIIIVGTAGVFTSNTFRYGKCNGLYEIERIGESDQQIVTRLRAYGSSENLPQHYYATLNKRVYATITNINGKYGTQGASFIIDLDYDSKYFTYQSDSYPTTGNFPNYIVNISANDISVRAYVTKDSSSDKCYVYCEYTGGVDDRDEPDASAMSAFVTALANGDKVYFEDYVKKETFGDGHYEFSSENLPDNMSISRLMLPGFPNQSLHDWVEAHKNQNGYEWLAQAVEDGFTFSTDKYRPYIDSPNIDRYGVRPASIMFDGTDETDDIHPTIEGMKIGNDPVDEIYAVDQVEDNGVYPAGEDVKNINIILPTLGFDLSKVFEDGATIDMKNGMCGARSFKIEETPTKDSNNHWICNVSRVHDESLDLWFPYEDFQIHGSSEAGRTSGDKYVLTGITMPDAYIDSAAVRLLQAAIEALKKNHAPRYTYQPRIDEIWMQRQHDSSIENNDVVSLHDTLKAGDIFAFADDDLNIDANIIIDILTIRENGNNGIPTYEITLRDDKEVGTVQKIANKIDSVFSSAINGAGGGSGLTPQQIQSIVRKEGNDRYLSKIDDDTAKGNISFEKNINVGGRETVNEIQSTEYTGDGLLDTGYRLWYEEGRAKLVIDDLVARGKFTANELETRIWTYAGGNMVFSGAGSTLFFVEYLDASDNPLGYTYINQPWLLRGRALLAGGLAWSKRKAIQRELTEAEKAQVVKFRCYEYSDDGTMQTRNWWKPNDIAMCETLNKVRSKASSDGSYSGSASNTVYKRRIAGIGSKEIPMLNDGRVYDYVDLWNIYDLAGNSCKYKGTDGQEHLITDSVKGYDSTYHDWPAAGDVIVQMGNPLDTDRQSAVTIEVQGDVHGFKVYDTISDYSLANDLWVEIGYDQTTGKAKANVYGDFRFGCRESEEANGGSYVKYNRTTRQLDIKATINAQSTLGSKNLKSLIDEKSTTYHSWEEWVDSDNDNILKVDDLFIPDADTTQSGVTYKQGKIYRCTQVTPSIAFTQILYTDDSSLNGYINAILNGSGASGDAATAAAAQKAILDAIDGVTVVNGGLILSDMLVLRKYNGSGDVHDVSNYTTWSGISGIYDDSVSPVKGHGLAAWYGGAMVDIEDLTNYWTAQQIAAWEALTPVQKAASALVAKSADRFDGSGYRASGNISWDKDGVVTIKGQTIKTANFYLNDVDITDTLNAILDMFELDTTTISGTTLIKAKYSLYSVGDISAMGQSSGGGGGGGASVLYELNDVIPNTDNDAVYPIVLINKANYDGYVLTYDGTLGKWYAAPPTEGVTSLSALTDTAISSPANGQALVYNSTSGKWENGNMPSVPDTIFYQRGVVYDAYINGTTYTNLASGTYIHPITGAAESLIHFQINGSSATGLDLYFDYTQGASNSLKYRKCVDSSRFSATSWVTFIDSLNLANYLTNNLKTINGNSLVGSGNITIGGGGGSGTVTSIATGTGLTGGTITTSGTISIDSTYQTKISHGESAYNSLSDYLAKSGGTMTGVLGLKAEQYTGPSGDYGMNCNNSDIVGVNSIYTNDLSDDWQEAILFKRSNSNWDSFRAADGTFYFHANNNSSYAALYCGSLYATGDVTSASDERKKDFVENVNLTVEQIANAPAVKFRWKDKRDELVHVGTYAQYWQNVLPESVSNNEDKLGLNYGAAAMVSVIKVAERVVTHEDEIEQLKKWYAESQDEIKAQKQRIRELEHEVELLKTA